MRSQRKSCCLTLLNSLLLFAMLHPKKLIRRRQLSPLRKPHHCFIFRQTLPSNLFYFAVCFCENHPRLDAQQHCKHLYETYGEMLFTREKLLLTNDVHKEKLFYIPPLQCAVNTLIIVIYLNVRLHIQSMYKINNLTQHNIILWFIRRSPPLVLVGKVEL